MPRVFISHSSKDREFIEHEIVDFLQEKKIDVWYSKESIATASYWERSILNGLKTSDWFLLIMSPHSALSEWVKDEVHWAVDNMADRIIPILLPGCTSKQFHIR